jgi:CheY-like chemotaxis protein
MSADLLPTVLVVDDEPDLQEVISFEFETRGFRTLSAGSGHAAEQLAEQERIDAVITDIRMPGGDGVQLLRSLKDGHPDTPVLIFITAFADLSVEQAYDLGAEGIFTKPFQRSGLVESVARALTARSVRWSERGPGGADLELERDWSDLDEVIQNGQLRIGRGGFFLRSSGAQPHVGESIDFRIRFERGAMRELSGRGRARWTRGPGTERPAGFGLEIEFLEESCRGMLIERIERERPISFIPRG